jgi:pimeloyl-ACP methyl ester carboxylesterase
VESSGRGAPLVLVHGEWGDHHDWDAVAPALAGSFRVVRYDRRGHSQSGGHPSGGLRQNADDLAGLIAELRLGPAHVVATSYGASVALDLASRAPELLASLVVHEPPLFDLVRDDAALSAALREAEAETRAALALVEAGDPEGAARRFVETLGTGEGTWARTSPAARARLVANAGAWAREMSEESRAKIDLQGLARCNVPVRLTSGSDSAPCFPAITDAVARALPDHSRRHMLGWDHAPHASRPYEWTDVTLGWLGARSEVAPPA